MANHRVPRTYHSVSVLMADARVFTGGGGLCGGCSTNHFDGEIFTPAYLLRSDGRTLAARPTITAASSRTIKVGSTFMATVRSSGVNGNWTFSIVRSGSSTHTVNSDQRRVPLVQTGNSKGCIRSVCRRILVLLIRGPGGCLRWRMGCRLWRVRC